MRLQLLGGARRFLSSRRKPERFSTLASALRVFYEQNEHFLVPFNFQVPSKNSPISEHFQWPEETLGLNLGREIGKFIDISSSNKSPKLLAVRRQLEDLGFPEVLDWKRFRWDQVVFSALKKYKEIYGDLLVTRKFVVPEGDHQWPRATWGLKLGSQVNSIRHKRHKLFKYQVEDLADIGFVYVVADYVWDVQFMPSLRNYRELYGHCEVPQVFVVGEGDSDEKNDPEKWPQSLKGYRLGMMVNRIRAISAYEDHVDRDRKELETLGFHFASNDHKWEQTILPAFKTYREVYGNCNINPLFMVPETKPWPRATWGLRLGFIARNIRNRGDFFRQIARDYDELEEIGFVWNVHAAKWEYVIIPALTTYVQEYGNAEIPSDFVVPSMDPWPEASHELKLGELANISMRRKRFANFIEIDRLQLEALGFFWSALANNDELDEDENYELW